MLWCVLGTWPCYTCRYHMNDKQYNNVSLFPLSHRKYKVQCVWENGLSLKSLLVIINWFKDVSASINQQIQRVFGEHFYWSLAKWVPDYVWTHVFTLKFCLHCQYTRLESASFVRLFVFLKRSTEAADGTDVCTQFTQVDLRLHLKNGEFHWSER